MARTEAVQALRAERDALAAALVIISDAYTLRLAGDIREGSAWALVEGALRTVDFSRVAATDQGTNSSAGSGCDTEPGAGPHAALVAGEGPHDATSSPCGGAAEGTLPAPGNPPHAPRVLP